MKLFICILSVFLPILAEDEKNGCYFNDSSSSSLSDADMTCIHVNVSKEILDALPNPGDAQVVNLLAVNIDFDKDLMKRLTGLKSMLMYNSTIQRFEPESQLLQHFNMHHTNFSEDINFDKCCKNLRKLYLKNVKGINLENSPFTKLTRLHQLQISHIPCKHLSKKLFSGLKSLKNLRISDMHFETSDADAFSELTNLKELYLDDDEAVEINPEIFKPLKKLRVLSIHAKKLKPLPLEMFSELKELREIGLPLKTWREIDVTKIPEMFPKLTSFSYTEEYERKDRPFYTPLFKKLNDMLLKRNYS